MKKEVSILLVLICFVLSFTTFQSCLKEADLPKVTTTEVINIKTQSALFEGVITDDGGAVVDICGVCWGTADNPSTDGFKKYCKESNGSFHCIVLNLIPNTYYHLRAFATNRAGTAYGNEVHFRTKQIIEPKVTTTVDTLSPILFSISAVGNVKCFDETYIIERGLCWATTPYPNTNNNILRCGEGSGSFENYLYSLEPGTLYYVRAYAITIAGITFGNEIKFKSTTLPEIITAPVTEFSRTTARVDCNLNDSFFYDAAGICYGTTTGPTVQENSIVFETGIDGMFSCTLTDLNPGTLYYARGYYTISEWCWWIHPDCYGTFIFYGNEVTFTTNQ